MKTLIEEMVKAVVDHPDAVSVTETEKETPDTPEAVTVYEVRVDSANLGQVIGKEGRIVNAIRAIARGVAMKEKRHISVLVVEE